MAVIHPQDRAGDLYRKREVNRGPLHPAVGLGIGFGFIVSVATLVHVVFNMVT